MIYDKVMAEHQKLEKQIKVLQTQIEKCPDGKLICAANGKNYKWYRSDGHHSTYIPKSERQLAERLAYKKYLSLQLTNLIQEKKAIDAYLKHHDVNAYQKEQSFVNSTEYKELLQKKTKILSEELEEWVNAPYPRNESHPEKLVHKTYSGCLVRSKSEALIEMFLYKNNIPFRYECLLQRNGTSIYPDFTIRHPKTGEVFYWEHFGMVDNPDYCKKMQSKLQFYISNGIIPTIQLITTYETKEYPLSTEKIERTVEEYFL